MKENQLSDRCRQKPTGTLLDRPSGTKPAGYRQMLGENVPEEKENPSEEEDGWEEGRRGFVGMVLKKIGRKKIGFQTGGFRGLSLRRC